MNNQEKVIKLINIIEQLFDYFDIDDVIMTDDYNENFELFSNKLNEIFKDGLNKKTLEMISKIDKTEIFYIEQVEEYKNNKIRKEIVKYLDNTPLYFNDKLIKKYIKENYKLGKYVKDKEKLLELLELNEKVILLIDVKYLTEKIILNQMKKSNLITEIFLGMHVEYNNIYKFSMFYKNNKDINKLLYEQSKMYLEQDIYKYINASELVKNNIDIAKLILKINPKFYHYISDEIKNNKDLKEKYNEI